MGGGGEEEEEAISSSASFSPAPDIFDGTFRESVLDQSDLFRKFRYVIFNVLFIIVFSLLVLFFRKPKLSH